MNGAADRNQFHVWFLTRGFIVLLISTSIATGRQQPGTAGIPGSANQSTDPQPNAQAVSLAAKREHALTFIAKGQLLLALPLCEDLATALPEDAIVHACLAYCLFAKAAGNVSAEEWSALMRRAREAALRARELGDKSQRLNEVLTALDNPGLAQHPPYSFKLTSDPVSPATFLGLLGILFQGFYAIEG